MAAHSNAHDRTKERQGESNGQEYMELARMATYLEGSGPAIIGAQRQM
jgi:hypothetical protein